MASIIKANQLQDFGGNSIITSDGAGNVTVNAAAMKNTPAFEAKMSANQTISTGTDTKIVFDTEIYDTDSAYDTSNYKFTPTVAGKYQVGLQVRVTGSAQQNFYLSFFKNGSKVKRLQIVQANLNTNQSIGIFTGIVELNGSTDYLEAYINMSGSTNIYGNNDDNYFTAYRIIGA